MAPKGDYGYYEPYRMKNLEKLWDPDLPLKPLSNITWNELVKDYPLFKMILLDNLYEMNALDEEFFEFLNEYLSGTLKIKPGMVTKELGGCGHKGRVNLHEPLHSDFTSDTWLRQLLVKAAKHFNGSVPSSLKKQATPTNKKPETKKEEKTTMATGKTSMEKTKTLETVKEAMVHGAQVAVADEAGEVMLNVAQVMLGDAYPALLATPDGKEVAKGMTAIALMYAIDSLPGIVPQEEGVRAASAMVLEAVSRDLVQPRLKRLEPVLLSLASAGAKVLSPVKEKTGK